MPLAVDLTAGMRIAVCAPRRNRDGTSLIQRVAAEVLQATRRPNGSVFLQLQYLDPWSGRGRGFVRGHRRVELLTDHYGVCHHCGNLAPCGEELIEREVRQTLASADPLHDIERRFGTRSMLFSETLGPTNRSTDNLHR